MAGSSRLRAHPAGARLGPRGGRAERVYATLPDLNFSERVLVPAADRLGVMRVKGVEWSDWGNAERVFATIRRTGWRPRWLDHLPPR